MAAATELEVGRAIGAAVPRKEDAKLLAGQGEFMDNLSVPGMVWMAIVRSPYAHARIRNVDLSAALAAPGVTAAYSAAELVQVDYEPLPVVVDAEAALAPDAPLVHEEFETNRCYTWAMAAGEVET